MFGIGKNWQLANAVHKGNLAKSLELLKTGANPNASDRHGNPLITVSASKGFDEITMLLVEQGATVNKPATEDAFKGATALHFASCGENPSIVGFLIEHGSDVNAQDCNGLTPIDWARQHRQPLFASRMVQILQTAGGQSGKTLSAYYREVMAPTSSQDIDLMSVANQFHDGKLDAAAVHAAIERAYLSTSRESPRTFTGFTIIVLYIFEGRLEHSDVSRKWLSELERDPSLRQHIADMRSHFTP